MGIFANHPAVQKLWTRYAITLQFRDRVAGGVPRDPLIMQRWLQRGMGITKEEEIRRMTIRTLNEMGVEVDGDTPLDQLEEVSHKLAHLRQSNGFKVHPDLGLVIEDRQIKAMIKEATNILFAGERWKAPGQKTPGKGPKSFLAERVFVYPQPYIGFLPKRMEPDDIELFIGHVTGPKGATSNLTYYEVVHQPALQFEIVVLQDAVLMDHWAMIWEVAQRNGFGAMRSQSFGEFDITRMDRIEKSELGDERTSADFSAESARIRELYTTYAEEGRPPAVASGPFANDGNGHEDDVEAEIAGAVNVG